jgi:transposase
MNEIAAGLTVADLAKRFRVSPDKVRLWIKRGELSAVNTANARCGKPRFVVTADALAAFEQGRQATPPKAAKRKKRTNLVDYFPD